MGVSSSTLLRRAADAAKLGISSPCVAAKRAEIVNHPSDPSDLDASRTGPAPSEELDPATLARITEAMTASGRYQLVERFERRTHYHRADGTPTKVALYLDVETTGTDPARHKIIQLACTPFRFDPLTGRIFEVGECEVWFEDPGEPIPPEITELTGITDRDVAGQQIDDERACQLLREAVLVIAHNAYFDRRFLERRLPLCRDKHWACSRSDVPWESEGLGGTKLAWLAYRQCRIFYEEHRASSDCLVGIHLLASTLPKSGGLAMNALLQSARRRTVRVWAIGSDKSTRHVLKARGYRWSDGSEGRPFAWWRDVEEANLQAELAWLDADVYVVKPGAPATRTYDARVRYSDRVDELTLPVP